MADDPWGQFEDAHPATVSLERLRALGAEVSNGFRVDRDDERIRRQGYRPARNSAHKRGDGVDLTPGRSGLSMKQLEARARQEFGPQASILNEGHHVHLAVDGWGNAPDVTRDDPWDAFDDAPGGGAEQARATAGKPARTRQAGTPTGQAIDGDTLPLSTGRNARLLGVDAWELAQQGRRPDNSLVPLGNNARDFLAAQVSPETPIEFTGEQTYGRPVATLGEDGSDPANALLRGGHGLASPEYLKDDPRFGSYMQAERLARQNRLGGHGTNAETPQQFRRKDGPWAGAEPGKWGEGQALFGDEPTPFYGLRPEIEQAYVGFVSDPANLAKWKADPDAGEAEIAAWSAEQGFTTKAKDVRRFLREAAQGGEVGGKVSYEHIPRPLTDVGDGATGAFVRGVGDPFNFIDELGGVADTLGVPTFDGPRENIWNSDRRFGDQLWNNIDQNRAIIAHDDQAHPVARFSGQVASAVLMPGGITARTPAALARFGAIEGGVAGGGAGEGGIVDRLPSAGAGAALGGAGGYALGRAADDLARRGDFRRGAQAADEGAPGVSNGLQDDGPIPTGQGQGSAVGSAAMRMDDGGPELVGPALGRERDYINAGRDRWAEFQDAPFGVTRPINERLSSDKMAMIAADVDPRGAVPRPGNLVEGVDEAVAANPGRFEQQEVPGFEQPEAPDEFDRLTVRKIRSPKDFNKFIRVRGPLDLTQRLRTYGGVKDDGGELAHLGITNEPRRLDFGSNEQFLGRLVDNDRGLDLDEATFRLWEEGYFPEFRDRPMPDDLVSALKLEAMGQRRFHPDDMAEVAGFYDAQANRFMADAAREGGHSITLDDLAADTYEDMPRLTGKIGNLNLDYIEQPEQVAALVEQIASRVGGFSAAARGKITHEETRRLAQEMGVKPAQLLQRRQGQTLNAEQLAASRMLVQASRTAVARLAKGAVGGSDDDVATFRKAWLKHAALEEQVAGATAEAGRALSQFRIVARAQDAGAEAVRSYLKGAGGRESIEQAAEAIVDLMEDPAKASHFMREAVKPRWRDKFNELWINSLLSGPRTHVVNFVGNTLTTALSFPEHATTAAIGKITRSADRAYFGEVGARAVGLADSSIEALRNMRRAFRTGEAQDATSKIEAVHQKAIGGKLGEVIRIPGRALTAADEFWKTLLGSAELRQLAYRQAKRETGGGEAFGARYAALLRDPPEGMTRQAQASARYYTFQRELGPAGRGIQQWSNSFLLGKILTPFVRTPINLLKFAGERSAFGLAMPEVRAALKSGGRARDEALAKITIGSGLSTAAAAAALSGRVTGSGPGDPQERAALLQAGWQPNSIRVGDQWVSYARFDPVSTLFGVAADFAEAGMWATKREADAIAMNLGMGIAKNITNKTWLSGLSDAFDVLSDPERYGKGYVQKLIGSAAVPAIVGQSAQAIDPHLRDARSIADAIKARVPVLSKSLPVRRDVWGEPVSRGAGGAIEKGISPVYRSRIKRDPLSQEIARLRAPLSRPPRSITIDRRKVDLTPAQFDEYVQLSGKPARAALEAEIASPEWKGLTDNERRELVRETFKDFRAAARDALVQNHPELGGETGGDAWLQFKDAE